MTHYDVLGISRVATAYEIKQAYRTLVKQYHPDINPDPVAAELIVKITEAYEVLSDPIRRETYDYQLNGIYHPTPEPQVNEEELRRREYLKRKREEEQRLWEQQLLIKTKFYRYQRFFAYPFLLICMIFSLDYFYTPAKMNLQLDEVRLNPAGYSTGRAGSIKFETDVTFYDAALASDREITIHQSGVFNDIVGITINESYFTLHGTLHAYGNFFTYLLLLLCLVMLNHKKYSDFALTIGILPFFIVLFLLMSILH